MNIQPTKCSECPFMNIEYSTTILSNCATLMCNLLKHQKQQHILTITDTFDNDIFTPDMCPLKKESVTITLKK